MAAKKLCKWKKAAIDEKMDKLQDIVSQPRYVCRNCARAASDRKYLCKPEKL